MGLGYAWLKKTTDYPVAQYTKNGPGVLGAEQQTLLQCYASSQSPLACMNAIDALQAGVSSHVLTFSQMVTQVTPFPLASPLH